MSIDELGEFGLIAHLNGLLAVRDGVQVGIGDDCAILDRLRHPVITTDALVEGIHFRRDWTTPRALGRKAMAVNVSDIAAMGGAAVAAFVSLGISSELLAEPDALPWLEELYAGFEDMADQFGFTVAGGDTTRARHDLFLSITMIGECKGATITRGGAKPNDVLIVTGTLGDSAAGLYLLQHPEVKVSPATRDYLLQRHFEPEPRNRAMFAALAANLRNPAVTAAIDISDGLSGDVAHIARASGLSLQIDAAKLPISQQAREVAALAGIPAWEWALGGGEDYELLLCIRRKEVDAVLRLIDIGAETKATIIGRCVSTTQEPTIYIRDENGHPVAPNSWQHF